MRTRQQSKPKNPLAFGTSCHWEGFWWMSQILWNQHFYSKNLKQKKKHHSFDSHLCRGVMYVLNVFVLLIGTTASRPNPQKTWSIHIKPQPSTSPRSKKLKSTWKPIQEMVFNVQKRHLIWYWIHISASNNLLRVYIYIHIHNLHKYAYAKRTRIYIRTSICIYLYLSIYPPISWFIYMSHGHTVGLLSKAWCECNFLNKRNALATLRPILDSKQNLCGECIFSGSHVKSH